MTLNSSAWYFLTCVRIGFFEDARKPDSKHCLQCLLCRPCFTLILSLDGKVVLEWPRLWITDRSAIDERFAAGGGWTLELPDGGRGPMEEGPITQSA